MEEREKGAIGCVGCQVAQVQRRKGWTVENTDRRVGMGPLLEDIEGVEEVGWVEKTVVVHWEETSSGLPLDLMVWVTCSTVTDKMAWVQGHLAR